MIEGERIADLDREVRALLAAAMPVESDEESRSDRLRAHGLALRALFLKEPARARLLAGRLSLDGPPGDLLATRRFVLGWAADEAGGADTESFASALDALIWGLAARAAAVPRPLYARLHTLLSAARERADILYSRSGQLPELDRRILLILFRSGARAPKELTQLTGLDKAQVSRATKRLATSGLIERDAVRRPIALSPEGRQLTAKLRRLHAARSRELLHGVGPRDLARFFDALDAIGARATALFEEERARDGSGERSREPGWAPDLVSEATRREPEIVPARLIALLSYIQRSAALCYKRLLGLSHFEAWVLAEIARDPPVDWSHLSASIARDESQAARTVRRLLDLGLIEHHGPQGRRQGPLRPTGAGAGMAAVVEEQQWRRDALLMEGIAPDVAHSFLAVLDRMTLNIQAQLVRDLAQKASGAGR